MIVYSIHRTRCLVHAVVFLVWQISLEIEHGQTVVLFLPLYYQAQWKVIFTLGKEKIPPPCLTSIAKPNHL